jgi:hypothetical protein
LKIIKQVRALKCPLYCSLIWDLILLKNSYVFLLEQILTI